MAVKKNCICAICKETFDRNSIQAVRYGARRYAHATCDPDNKDFVPMEQGSKKQLDGTQPDFIALKDYINEKYQDKANWALIVKQIKDYVAKGYTYTGMLSTLKYIFEVRKMNADNSKGGIGIIDFVYEEAKKYNYEIWKAQQHNEGKDMFDIIDEIIISPLESKKSSKLYLDWGD